MKGGGKRASGKGNNGPTADEGGSARSEKRGAASSDPVAGAELGHPTVEMARQLAAIVEHHALSELVVDTPELTLTLRRGQAFSAGAHLMAASAAMPAPTASSMPMSSPRASEPAPAAPATSAAPPAPARAEPDYHVVTSPFVGTFYRSPTPDSDPYAVEGQRVEKGQVLCIVEAMKLMNEIEADIAGVVVAVLVDNSQPVEYGQPLFRLSPP
jgi:acetyl-CoA carboxylase biotin carboxyl carrier protein